MEKNRLEAFSDGVLAIIITIMILELKQPVGSYPTSWEPLSIYFADMTLACISFHLMYYLIIHEKGEKLRFNARSIVSLITYFGATVLGGFCPVAEFIVVTVVSCWWIIPQKK